MVRSFRLPRNLPLGILYPWGVHGLNFRFVNQLSGSCPGWPCAVMDIICLRTRDSSSALIVTFLVIIPVAFTTALPSAIRWLNPEPWHRHYYYYHFADEKTEAPKCELTYLRANYFTLEKAGIQLRAGWYYSLPLSERRGRRSWLSYLVCLPVLEDWDLGPLWSSTPRVRRASPPVMGDKVAQTGRPGSSLTCTKSVQVNVLMDESAWLQNR